MSDPKTAALEYHAQPRPEKPSVELARPTATVRDLSPAYNPGAAEPVREIARDAKLTYQHTSKGNLMAVISDGTAILGLGNLDPLAFKPVMEGGGILFRRFANIDVFDIETNAESPQAFVNTVERVSITFGGINLENTKASECFEIERALIGQCDTPVPHDGQYGTVIVTAVGMLSALELARKELKEVKIIRLGVDAVAISCMRLLASMGAKVENIYMVSRKGVIHAGRDDLNQYEPVPVTETDKCIPTDALGGVDVLVGLSGANLLEPEDPKRVAPNPIVLACSNPNSETKPELVHATRDGVIMATGRSNYPNQVNNVLGSPFIFRGALGVRATHINEEMKIAVALALRDLAKQPIPEGVCAAYGVDKLEFGCEYIIPRLVDKRLVTMVFDAVAKAAIETDVVTLSYPRNCSLKSADEIFNG